MADYLSRILIVDDNKDIHEDIKQILLPNKDSIIDEDILLLKNELFGDDNSFSISAASQEIDYIIDDAFQGEEAIKMVRRAVNEEYPYSMIFIDVRMPPGMDGVETLESIWKVDPHVEAAICTAYSDYTWDQILSKFGQTDQLLILKKPLDSISIKQTALSLTTKWKLERANRFHIENLELQVSIRTQDLNNMIQKLKAEISLRQAKERQLAYLANYDSLTGMLNRHCFYKTISKVVQLSSSSPKPISFALLFIDLDGFKQVNDTLGHDAGDILLEQVSDKIKLSLKDSVYKLGSLEADEERTDNINAIFRVGGDEFTAIIEIEKEKDKKFLEKICSELIQEIQDPIYIDNSIINISCSIGLSIYPQDNTNAMTLLKYADISMYKAKKTRGAYVLYETIKDSLLTS